ncbi:MAG TPA: hypothetical protein PK987_00170 [Ferruginibacter sp.]|nr:hypothetical protein [Ferruginibacter sp.]
MKLFFNLLFLFLVVSGKANTQRAGFDKQAFYNAMSADNLQEINALLEIVKNAALDEKEAYEGALLMKKAGLVSKAKEKLNLFKSGRTKLEAAIKKDNTNTEFVFLRLIIQEHAPKALKYNSHIVSDSEQIRNDYKNLPPVVQKAILAYSKKSKVLKTL